MSLLKLICSKWREFGSFHKLYVGLLLFFAYNKKHTSRPKRTIRKVVVYYRICDKGYPKEKPDYITKENCLRNVQRYIFMISIKEKLIHLKFIYH